MLSLWLALVWRVLRAAVVTAVGAPVTVLGLVMLVTPGPGLLVLAAGVGVLALEYRWARQLLVGLRARLARVRSRS